MRRYATSSVRRTTSVMGYSFLLVSRSFSSVFHRPRALSSSAISSSSPIVFSFRSYLVQFQPTPNDSCMKFFVENVAFLTTPPSLDPSTAAPSSSSAPLPPQPGEIDLDSQSNRSNTASSSFSSTPPTTAVAATFTFDQSNQHQSPLANAILSALPMVSEVVIGPTFVTVRRMEAEEFEERVREAKAEVAPPPGAQGGQAPVATSAMNPFAASVNPLGGGVSAPLPPPPATSTTQSPEQQQKAEGTNQHHSEDDEELSHYQRQKRQEVGMSGDANVSSSSGEGGGDPLHELDEDTLRKLFNMLDWSELKYVVSALITDHLYSGDPHIALDAPHPHMDTMPQEGDSEIVLSIKELITTSIRPVLQADGGDIRFLSYRDEAAAAVVVGDEGIKKAEQTLSTAAEETDVMRQPTTGECGKASLSAPTPSLVADEGDDASRQEVHGVVVIELLGSCKSCKSAKTTLTDLIERTMRHWIPEVKKIEAMLRIGTRSELVPLEVAIKQQQ